MRLSDDLLEKTFGYLNTDSLYALQATSWYLLNVSTPVLLRNAELRNVELNKSRKEKLVLVLNQLKELMSKEEMIGRLAFMVDSFYASETEAELAGTQRMHSWGEEDFGEHWDEVRQILVEHNDSKKYSDEEFDFIMNHLDYRSTTSTDDSSLSENDSDESSNL